MPTYLTRPRWESLTGTLTLEVLRSTDVVELAEGDEFITVNTQIDLFEGRE